MVSADAVVARRDVGCRKAVTMSRQRAGCEAARTSVRGGRGSSDIKVAGRRSPKSGEKRRAGCRCSVQCGWWPTRWAGKLRAVGEVLQRPEDRAPPQQGELWESLGGADSGRKRKSSGIRRAMRKSRINRAGRRAAEGKLRTGARAKLVLGALGEGTGVVAFGRLLLLREGLGREMGWQLEIERRASALGGRCLGGSRGG